MKTRSIPRPVLMAALLIASCLIPSTFGQPAPTPGRGGPQIPRVTSPEVLSDRKVSFRIYAPKAEKVRLTGGDMPQIGQGMEMTKGTNDVWEAAVGPVNPGAYRYNFNVDGVSVIDPRNPATSESNENTWSLVLVPGAEFMDTRDVPHGAVAAVTYRSTTLDRFRRMHVYTPPGYESGQGRFPVFYLLHGAFDCDDSWTSVGRAGFILDNLIAAGKAKPMIVVMPAGHTGPFRFGGSFNNEFERDFMNDIVPLVEKRYRVLTGRENRAIAGLSMGGAQTLNIGFGQLDKFAYLGVYSSGVFGMGGVRNTNAPAGPTWEERNQAALDDPKLKEGLKLVWFATGKEDFLLKTSQATVEMLRKHGFDVTYKETEGAHTWINWREYLNEFAPQLFQPAQTSGVSGSWRAEFDTQIGVQKYLFTLKVDGEKVTGKAASDIGGEKRDTELTEGKFAGGEVFFVENLDFQGNPLRITYQGKVKGDEIQFTRKVGDVASEEFTAKRVVAANAGGR